MINDVPATLWRRVARANEHLEFLVEQRSIAINDNRHRITVGHLDTQTGDYVLAQLPSLPMIWGLRIGEFTHNARSVLDNLVNALVRRRGNAPTRSTAFPICDSVGAWRRRTIGNNDALLGLSNDDRALIDRLQPYHRSNPPLNFVERQPLSMLRWLSNYDKHKLMPVVTVAATFDPLLAFLRFPDGDGGNYAIVSPRLYGVQAIPFFAILFSESDDEEFARIHFATPSVRRGPEVRVDLGGSIDIAFGGRPSQAASGADVSRVLRVGDLVTILDQVKLVIRLFEAEF